ncbi:reverse transcriptase [Plakobranchus ocellatus]|uniref:Reverse transcriptase n=1 Tax=Plakobranchus ocellatus TaxID=259542 RepID=A0AAV3XH80_9GAST|nr:reverse transcriptase [Plakobranchus ocellatus]
MPNNERCSHDPPKTERIMDQPVPLRLRLGTRKGLRYPCICGRRFSTEKGMKIHRIQMKYLDNSKNRQQRSAQADKTLENQGQVQNHSAEKIHASDPEAKFRQISKAKIQ